MLSLIRRSFTRRPRPVRRPTNRLRLEALESRHCPAPVISNLDLVQGMGHSVVVMGNVQDQMMGGMQISVSGAGSGQGGINSDGSFNVMVNAAYVGTFTVTATDIRGQTGSLSAGLVNYAPGLVMVMSYLPHKQVRLYGHVSDEVVTTVTINFSGAVNGSVMAGSDGSFSYTVTPTGLGDVQAHATDQWGLESNPDSATISNAAPVITKFTVTDDPDLGWMVHGLVSDESPAGLGVTIMDPNRNNVATPTVTADGYFSSGITLAPGMYGAVTAQTTDWWGLQSNIAWVQVTT